MKWITGKIVSFQAIVCAGCVLFFVSCKKDAFISSPDISLRMSADSVFFDTVFTSSGSVTKSVKIYNDYKQNIKLSSIRLLGGSSSPFTINMNGRAATEVSDITLPAGDSIYLFVQVNVQPTAANAPFVIEDSIRIMYNGNQKMFPLKAYGQNAIFLTNEVLTGHHIWTSELPYVILGGIRVDTNAVLTIQKGAKIYLHANAPFLVDGSVQATGTKEERIVFSGDRPDAPYNQLPAAWPGIYFRNTSEDNYLEYTIVKNGYQGIIVQSRSSSMQPKLTLSKCIIDNIYDVGLLALNTDVVVENSLISNCGKNVSLLYGGMYHFDFCTIVSYGNSYIPHKKPVLEVRDYFMQDGMLYTAPLKALFQNTILWGDNGSVDDEIITEKKGNELFDVSFNHVLYKAKTEVSGAAFLKSIKNVKPGFDSVNVSRNMYDFRFLTNPSSPAIGAGIPSVYNLDLDGKMRNATAPDIGCYER